MFYSIIQVFITFFICILIGFLCMRTKIVDQHILNGFSSLLINVAIPALVIISMQNPFSLSLFYDASLFFITSLTIYLACILLGLLVCKLFKASPSERSIWLCTAVFPNSAFMGMPLINAVYGQEALFFASINLLIFNTLIFTVGVLFMQRTRQAIPLKVLLFKPIIPAIITGFLFFIFSFSIPAPIYNTMKMLGDMTTPLAMIIIGAQLSEMKFREIFIPSPIYFVYFLRLIAIPMIIYISCSHIFQNPMLLNITVLLFATPTAAMTTVLAVRYDADCALASKSVFVTTILSLITIPVISLLLR